MKTTATATKMMRMILLLMLMMGTGIGWVRQKLKVLNLDMAYVGITMKMTVKKICSRIHFCSLFFFVCEGFDDEDNHDGAGGAKRNLCKRSLKLVSYLLINMAVSGSQEDLTEVGGWILFFFRWFWKRFFYVNIFCIWRKRVDFKQIWLD